MAESKRDYYEVLGVSRDADDAALKKAYSMISLAMQPLSRAAEPAAMAVSADLISTAEIWVISSVTFLATFLAAAEAEAAEAMAP